MKNKVFIELNNPESSISWGKKVSSVALELRQLGFEVEVKLNGSVMSLESIVASIGQATVKK